VDTIMRRTAEPMIPQVSSPTWPPRVTVEQARQLVQAGQAVIVDVRSAESFDQRHIPGSVNIPLPDLSARIDELPEGKRLLTVCT
jgi:rhodanese-related sulfurtransferase